jgi:outer membrane protein TolC
MKRVMSRAVSSQLAAGTASAADLVSVYRDALANDPTIRHADALRKASQQVKPEAWAALLPQIAGQGQYTRGSTEAGLVANISENDNRAFCDKPLGDRFADPAGRARDQRNPAWEPHHGYRR